MSILLGLDLGTQSLKAIIYDSQHQKTLAATSSPIDIDRHDDGSAEQKANWWLDALCDCLQQIPEMIRLSVDALSLSGQQHGLVAMNDKGEVLCSVKLWCDTSTTSECEYINRAFGGVEVSREQLGNSIIPGYTASKILWLKRNHFDLYQQLGTILLPHDYLNFVLTGNRVMEYGDASGTGLLDVRQRRWSSKMLRILDPERDLRECLPELMPPHVQIGKILPEIAQEYGLPAGIPVATGGGDNMMAAIGTGNIRDGILTISLGTSGTVYGFSSRPVIDPLGEISAFCSSSGGWLALFCTMNCTGAIKVLATLLDGDLEQLENHLVNSNIGADGVVSVPFYQGERIPNLPNATATLAGLTHSNTISANILRATVEGVTFALRYGLDRLRDVGLVATEIRLIGGGSKSPAWCQMIADVCNLPVKLLENEEAAAFGAALQALWMLEACSLQSIVDTHVRLSNKTYFPQVKAAREYKQAYKRYRETLSLLTQD